MLTNTHGLLLGSRGRTAQELSCLSSSSKYSEKPNTMRFLIHVLFWPCTTRQAKASFSFLLLSHTQCITSALCTVSRQLRLHMVRNYQELKNKLRERETEGNIHKASKRRKSLAGVDKALLQLFKIQKPAYYILLGNIRNDRDFVYSVFNSSTMAKAVFLPFHLLNASIL